MRAVVVKDPHLRFGRSRPVGRKAGFFDEVTAKLDFVRDYCKSNKIEFLIFTGDILDQKDPSKYSFKCYQENRDKLAGFGNIEKLSVYGNHDIVDGRYDESVYAEFARQELIQDISCNLGTERTWLSREVCLIGIGHIYDKLEFFGYLRAVAREINTLRISGKLVCVVHQGVVPEVVGSEGFMDMILYKDLVREAPEVDVWVCGHYHKGYPVMEVGGKVFINPYSLVRLNRGEKGREHVPQLVDCDFEKCEYKVVDIPYKGYDEVFEEESVVKEAQGFSDDIISNIQKLREGNALEEGLGVEDDEIKSLIEHYLTEADKVLGA